MNFSKNEKREAKEKKSNFKLIRIIFRRMKRETEPKNQNNFNFWFDDFDNRTHGSLHLTVAS